MRLFIAGKHQLSDVLRMRQTINKLDIKTTLVQFDKAYGYHIPDMNEKDTNALKTIVEQENDINILIS